MMRAPLGSSRENEDKVNFPAQVSRMCIRDARAFLNRNLVLPFGLIHKQIRLGR